MPTKTFLKLSPEKRERIIAVAVDEFSRRGYSGTIMDAVAEEAGIAKGALYRYFEGKRDLYFTVIDKLVDEFDAYGREFLEARKDQNVFQTMRDHLVSIYKLLERFSKYSKILCNIFYQEHLEFKGEVLAKFGKLTTYYTRLLLQRGIARGEVREDLDLDAAAFILDCVIDRFHDGATMQFVDHGFGLYQQPQEVINRKADQVVDAFRRGFGKRNDTV